MLLLILASGPVHGQHNRMAIENIHLDVVNNKIMVNYDLISQDTNKSYDIELRFATDKHDIIIPYWTSGDVGENIRPGINKSVVWEISKDLPYLRYQLFPMVVTDLNNGQKRYDGGPGNALMSLLVPGLGDHRVADPRSMKFKPLYRTASAYGLVFLGAYSLSQRYQEPDKTTLDNGRIMTYGKGDIHYRFFKWDAELFFLAGVTIWVYDIIWVISKGTINKKLQRSINNHSISLNYLPQGAGLTYSLRF